MKYSQVLSLVTETGLSYEEIAPVFGISNMTLRRWEKRSSNTEIPHPQQCSIREGVYKLLIDNKLNPNSKLVHEILDSGSSKNFEASIKSMGIQDLKNVTSLSNQDRLTMVLAEIGQNNQHMSVVDNSHKEILKCKSFGEDWSKYISLLMSVIKSKDIYALDKLVAYGALFYLIFPMDLVPDSIPVIGYLDDFAFLSLAAAFYFKKFPKLSTVK